MNNTIELQKAFNKAEAEFKILQYILEHIQKEEQGNVQSKDV